MTRTSGDLTRERERVSSVLRSKVYQHNNQILSQTSNSSGHHGVTALCHFISCHNSSPGFSLSGWTGECGGEGRGGGHAELHHPVRPRLLSVRGSRRRNFHPQLRQRLPGRSSVLPREG